MARKLHNQEAGYIAERMNPWVPGSKVVIYRAVESEIDVGSCKYVVVCDAHGALIGETNIPNARHDMKWPDEFCEECRKLADEN